MKTVWKYQIEPTTDGLTLPANSKILSVGVQFGKVMVWCLVDTEQENTEYKNLLIVGTGHPVPDNRRLNFIGTFMLAGGHLVLHLFEVV